jgi:hypothetical protein
MKLKLHATVDRRRMCYAKRRFACRGKAANAAVTIRRGGGPAMHAYRCPLCRGWHLTSAAIGGSLP